MPSTAPAAAARNTSAPNKRIQAMVKHFHDAKKPIFTAICHGVQILVAVDGVVRGKKVAALGACEPEVKLAGGTYIDAKPTEAWHVDGTMVSAEGWPAPGCLHTANARRCRGTEIRHGATVGSEKAAGLSSRLPTIFGARPASAGTLYFMRGDERYPTKRMSGVSRLDAMPGLPSHAEKASDAVEKSPRPLPKDICVRSSDRCRVGPSPGPEQFDHRSATICFGSPTTISSHHGSDAWDTRRQ